MDREYEPDLPPVVEEIEELPVMSNEETLQYVQGLRLKIVNHIKTTVTTQKIIDNDDLLKNLTSLLKDVASTAVADKRIDSDNQNAASDAAIAEKVMENNRRMARERAAQMDKIVEMVQRPPMISEKPIMEGVEPQPGETKMGDDGDNYDSFMEKMKNVGK